MSAKKRRIKRKIALIVRMDRQARGYWKLGKERELWAIISGMCRKKRGGYQAKAWQAIGESRLNDKPIYRPKLTGKPVPERYNK